MLTDRRQAIMDLLTQGMTVREIAKQLGISRNAVYQQIQWLRSNGHLPRNYTQTGLPARERQPGADLLSQLVRDGNTTDGEAIAAGSVALVALLRETRDELDAITHKLSAIVGS